MSSRPLHSTHETVSDLSYWVSQVRKFWYLLLVVIIATIGVYYWLHWRTIENFIVSIDHAVMLMQDFAYFYYPESGTIFNSAVPHIGYYYSSFFALTLYPISLMPFPWALSVWVVLQLLFIVLLCVFSIMWLNLRNISNICFITLFITSFPIIHNFMWGQVSIALTLCTLSAIYLASTNRSSIAIILLAFAAAIKFYPAIFIIYFFMKPNRRTISLFFIMAIVFYAVIPVLLLGFGHWFEFESTVYTTVSSLTWIAHDINSQYFVHVMLRWFATFGVGNLPPAAIQTLAILGYAIAAGCIILSWLLRRQGNGRSDQISVATLFLITPFIIQTSWPHYFVYLPICQTAILLYFWKMSRILSWRGTIWVILPIVSIILSNIFFFNLFVDWTIYSTYGMLFLSNLLLIGAVVAITFLPDFKAASTPALEQATQ